jgi:ribonuclease HII
VAARTAFDFYGLSIREIRAQLTCAEDPVSARLLRALRRDKRQGARALYAVASKRAAEVRRERVRLAKLLRRERALWRAGAYYVAGVDEVGIGPLAGPVVAAAVVFDAATTVVGVDDSKRLDAQTRTRLAAAIRDVAVGVGIGVATVAEIDRLNVYHAGLLAMRRAVEALPVPPEHVLVDARTIPGLPVPQRPIVRGDSLCFSIAAASIVAKVHRDQLMIEWDHRYPEYGFCRHKGYATAQHQAAIRRHGLCALHRRSYPFLEELCGGYSPRFYEIKERLTQARRGAALRAIELDLARFATTLDRNERHKLRLLIARRRRLVA